MWFLWLYCVGMIFGLVFVSVRVFGIWFNWCFEFLFGFDVFLWLLLYWCLEFLLGFNSLLWLFLVWCLKILLDLWSLLWIDGWLNFVFLLILCCVEKIFWVLLIFCGLLIVFNLFVFVNFCLFLLFLIEFILLSFFFE